MSTSVTSIIKRVAVAVAALSVTASGLLLKTSSVDATAAVTPISISNIPLTVAIPAHPQVVIAMGNSQSMDGDLSGAIMTGSGALASAAAAAGLANSSSPVSYTIPSGFTPPVNLGSAGVAPYTVTTAGVQYDNSDSRLNVAKAGITAILTDFVEYADFGLMDYSTNGAGLYTTWVYFMSPEASGFTFTDAPGANPYVANPCYGSNVLLGDVYNQACKHLLTYYGVGSGAVADQYVLVGPAGAGTSDDPAINDVLYAPAGYQPPVCVSENPSHPDPYPLPLPAGTFTLGNYNDGGVSEGYASTTSCITGMRPTNAGYVPFSPESMEAERGFGYDSGQSATAGNVVVTMRSSGAAPTAASVAAAIAPFTPYLAPETNQLATTEIKAEAEQSPIAGLLKGAKSYLATAPATTNGCPAKQYVVLVTDGLPTEDLNGHSWPPLGSEPGDRYGVTATFNGDGSLDTTNDQALQDAITEIQTLYGNGVKTYIIGLGAGVETAANPQAAATLTAMAIAGHTNAYFAAISPSDLTYDMQVILAQILAANQSTSSATVNTTGLNTSSMAYQPSFDTSDTDQDWTGDIKEYPIDPDTGAVETSMLQWSAQAQLDAQDAGLGYVAPSRIIATWDPVANAGTPFEWTGGSPAQGVGATTTLGEELETNVTDPSGQDALNYLRGDRALEMDASPAGPYRSRTHILGDIVDSAPLYIGPVIGPYQSSTYYTFAHANINRAPVLYVGANDGMLHAFDAATGDELFAYIPNGVYSNLISLTSPYYNEQHKFYVDGSPQASDVQFTDGTWHTELVGGERAGGRSIFALDVTDPASITNETILASKVLWDFSDPDMGLTYSTPAIAQTAAGASGDNLGFTVFFGNGYNSSSQRPFLYALDPQSGSVRIKIDLCAQVPSACDTTRPNGLSSVVVVNSIGGVGAPATTLYAGDLEGNVWRVDVTSATPADWVVSVLFQATDLSGVRQPITTVPVVSLNPDFPRLPGVMVYVGTGQMLGIPDLASTQVQTMYGIYDSDSNPSTLTRSNLEAQTLSALTATLRLISGGPIALPSQSGWLVDMTLQPGERFVTDPRLDSGAVVATTVLPAANTCNGGDTAWLMEFNYAGGTFVTPQFDTNGDGTLDSGDQIANGLALGSVYAAAPVIVKCPANSDCKRDKLITESSGAIQNVAESGAQQQRTAWWEIR
ncbi:MAG TPA: PilC/PilY family type IV pilus protein [Steroidobacteraceae bacterium]|nr:PilC/PilY family type IV pilus protein [Steroidobacteraceae bacterium]